MWSQWFLLLMMCAGTGAAVLASPTASAPSCLEPLHVCRAKATLTASMAAQVGTPRVSTWLFCSHVSCVLLLMARTAEQAWRMLLCDTHTLASRPGVDTAASWHAWARQFSYDLPRASCGIAAAVFVNDEASEPAALGDLCSALFWQGVPSTVWVGCCVASSWFHVVVSHCPCPCPCFSRAQGHMNFKP